MGVVRLFGQTDADKASSNLPVNDDLESAQIINLASHPKALKNVPPSTVQHQMKTVLASHGVDFSCRDTKKDFQIIIFLVQGIFDRQDGAVMSQESLLGETLRHVFKGDDNDARDTDELFGDLLNQL